MTNQLLDKSHKNDYWTQNTTSQAGPAGSVVNVGDTAPTGDQWNFVAVEVIGAAE